MSAVEQAASAVFYSRVRHRVATVTFRESLLGWVQSGCKTLHSARQSLAIPAGQAFVAARGTQWDVENDPAGSATYRALILAFPAELLSEFARRYPHAGNGALPLASAASLSFDAELQQAVERTLPLLDGNEDPVQTDLRQHRLLEILLLLAARGIVWPSRPLGWDERLRRHIGQRPHAAWPVAALAAAFHTSPATLRRRLQACGTSASEVVREVRLETGLALLQTTDLPVGDIADRCGYASHSRFTAAFRARYGFAPSQLRPDD